MDSSASSPVSNVNLPVNRFWSGEMIIFALPSREKVFIPLYWIKEGDPSPYTEIMIAFCLVETVLFPIVTMESPIAGISLSVSQSDLERSI